MPVHIREIVLKTTVDTKATSTASVAKTDTDKDLAQLVKEAVSQVLEVLDERKKR